MESGHVTDDVSVPGNDDDDDDVNNPFCEASSTSSASANGASDLLSKFHPGTVS